MAKALATAQVGDQVQVIKDDDNNGEIGRVTDIIGSTLVVSFGHTGNSFEYEPDDVILIPQDHILA